MKPYLYLSFIFVLLACASKNVTVNQTEPQIESLITDSKFQPSSAADYTVNSTELKDSTLTINVTYKGGCNGYHFQLFNNGNMMKSLPPKTSVFLIHQAEKENCVKLRTVSLKFNISTLKKMNPRGIVMVKLDGQESYMELKR